LEEKIILSLSLEKNMNFKKIFWLTALLVLFVLFHSNNLASVDYNSSRSNVKLKTPPGQKDTLLMYNVDLVSVAKGDDILNELVKQPVQKIDEKRVRDVLKQNGITGINSIILEPVGSTGLIIYLLKKPQDKSDAKKTLKKGSGK